MRKIYGLVLGLLITISLVGCSGFNESAVRKEEWTKEKVYSEIRNYCTNRYDYVEKQMDNYVLKEYGINKYSDALQHSISISYKDGNFKMSKDLIREFNSHIPTANRMYANDYKRIKIGLEIMGMDINLVDEYDSLSDILTDEK